MKLVWLLLEHRIKLINMQDEDGNTALMVATRNRCRDVVQLLLDYKADVHLRDLKGRTALCLARQKQHPRIEAILLRHYKE